MCPSWEWNHRRHSCPIRVGLIAFRTHTTSIIRTRRWLNTSNILTWLAIRFMTTTTTAFIQVKLSFNIFTTWDLLWILFLLQGVKYIITVKIGNQSPSHFDGNLGINIVAKNFDTGFIKLDENILVESNSLKADADSNLSSDPLALFKCDHRYVFQFEDQDIRTVRLFHCQIMFTSICNPFDPFANRFRQYFYRVT